MERSRKLKTTEVQTQAEREIRELSEDRSSKKHDRRLTET